MTTRSKKLIDRERLWELAKEIDDRKGDEGWGVKDLVYAFSRSQEYCAQAIRDWERWGYVRLTHRRGARKFYRVVPKEGVPPVTGVNGRVLRDTTPQQNMWRAMRSLRKFNYLDIHQHANTPAMPVSKRDVHAYCRFLANAGYLKVLRKADGRGKLARYQLVMDTGPLPPRERRVRGVWDDNEERFTYVAGGVSV